MHLIGYNLKKKNPGITWLADFRDPWSEWGLLESLKASKVAKTIHRRLEQQVLRHADLVTTVTPFYVRQFENLGQRNVHLLTNGYDEDDFRDLKISRAEKFIIRHVGIVNEKCDPRPFMKALKALLQQHPAIAVDVQVEFIGEVHGDFRNDVKGDELLSPITFFSGTIPHTQLLKTYGSSALLLLVLFGYKDAEGYMPGKLFEYLATGLPVLGIGPENGDAAVLLGKSGAGQMIEASALPQIQDHVHECYRKWKDGSGLLNTRGRFSAYSRKSITARLTEFLTIT
jgi:glycosyltransferase involved in cell wall biosynthesis